ncbi:MAG: acyltransferase [Aliarcobacter sp.]|jgi:acetyltransferase-like isoleucine patch superfamily enzyme|nr:acyltransferase [Aliarcobacter sp.]
MFKFLYLIIQRIKNKNKISFNTYIKNLKNIELNRNIKVHSNVTLDATRGKIKLGTNVILNRFCFINANKGNVFIGNGTEINNFTLINGIGGVFIGTNVLIGPNVQIISYTHNFKDKNMTIKEQGIEKKSIIIEDDVWIGASAIILAGITIARGSVIGANCVITKDTEPFSINVGIPSKKIAIRE